MDKIMTKINFKYGKVLNNPVCTYISKQMEQSQKNMYRHKSFRNSAKLYKY